MSRLQWFYEMYLFVTRNMLQIYILFRLDLKKISPYRTRTTAFLFFRQDLNQLTSETLGEKIVLDFYSKPMHSSRFCKEWYCLVMFDYLQLSLLVEISLYACNQLYHDLTIYVTRGLKHPYQIIPSQKKWKQSNSFSKVIVGNLFTTSKS